MQPLAALKGSPYRKPVWHGAVRAAPDDRMLSGQAGVLVRKRYSTVNPGEVTGYAVGLPQHVSKTGGTIWYGAASWLPI